MNKRYLAALAAALLLVGSLSGCKGRDTGETSASESSSESESSRLPITYNSSEAASINAGLKASDIRLVQLEAPKIGSQMATIHTNLGDIDLILFPEQAPKTVESFVNHAKSGYYTGLEFEKVLNNFILEGGDPDGKGGTSAFQDESGAHTLLDGEYSLDLWHFRGAVSMSDVDGKGGHGSRFFIVQAPFVDDITKESMEKAGYPRKVLEQYEAVGGTPGFDWRRTVIGMVTEESMQLVDTIARTTEVDKDGRPVETLLIESITIGTFQAQAESSEEDGDGADEGSDASGGSASESGTSAA